MATKQATQRDVLRLSAETLLDPRTVKRAIEGGVEKLRAQADRDRILEAAKRLGIRLG